MDENLLSLKLILAGCYYDAAQNNNMTAAAAVVKSKVKNGWVGYRRSITITSAGQQEDGIVVPLDSISSI